MRAGVRDDERPARALGDVEEALLGQVRAVDEDPELVAVPDEPFALLRQARPGGCPRIPELDTVAVRVRAAPDQAERAKAAVVPVPQVAGERLGAFEVEDRADLLSGDAALEIVD